MSLILIIIVLVLLFGGLGGGYYGAQYARCRPTSLNYQGTLYGLGPYAR
jgi:hypothetical protein